MKKRVVRFALLMVLGVAASVIWQSMYAIEPYNNYFVNRHAGFVQLYAQEYFSGSEESVTGVFTGEVGGGGLGNYIGEKLESGGYYTGGNYYVMVENSTVIQCYWERDNSLSERADELTAALDRKEPPRYINTRGDPIGGYPNPVKDYRSFWQWFFDELPWIAFGYIPLLVLLAVYVLALLLRPFAGRVWQRFIGSGQ